MSSYNPYRTCFLPAGPGLRPTPPHRPTARVERLPRHAAKPHGVAGAREAVWLCGAGAEDTQRVWLGHGVVLEMVVSIMGIPPKWMVYNGKCNENG